MSSTLRTRLIPASLVLLLAQQLRFEGASRQEAVDPALDAAVHRYFETQETEDVAAYLAQWSSAARRPTPAMLKFVFDSGDDRYSDITILRATPTTDGARVRVGALRERSTTNAQGVASTNRSRLTMSLIFVKEDGGWKLLREAPAVDDLAASLLEAPTVEARERLLVAEPDLVNSGLVQALSRRGTELVQGRQYPAAQSVYERALEIARRVGDRKLEGETFQNLANAFYYQRNFPRALECYEQRLAIERERQDNEAIASALVGVATIRYTYAEYGVALVSYREALLLQEKLPDQSAAATTLISTGNVQYLLGDFPAAIADYRRSRDLYRSLSDTTGEASALGGLGRVYVAQGDFAAALDAFAGVLAEGRARSDRASQGTALMSIGEVHVRLGNLTVARSAFEEGRAHFEAMSDTSQVGRVWQDLALVDVIAGTFPAAEREYGRSAEACNTAGDRDCVAGAAVGLGFAQAAQDKFDEAVASYKRAIDRFTALNRPEQAARAEIGLAQALTGLGRNDEALAAAVRARHAAVGLSLNDVLWRALVAEARAYRKTGEIDRALGSARAAIYAVDEMRETARTQPGSPLPRDTVTAFATLARLQVESGDASAAFDTSERMRVHDLRAVLTTNEREIARGMTAAERDDERAAAIAVASLRAQIARERALPRPDADRISDLGRSLTDAMARRAAQQEGLFARLPDLRVWRGLFEAATTADLARVLGSDTALLDFVVDDDGLVVMAAWQEDGQVKIEAKASPITRRALAESVAQMLKPATLKDTALWTKASAAILSALPAGTLERAARARHVLVVPHEMLWRLPFEALPVGEHPLGTSTALTYVPSISSRLRPPTPDPHPADGFVGVAGPTLQSSLTAHFAQTAPDWVVRPPEPAVHEVKIAAGDRDAASVLLLTGAAATKAGVRESLARAGVIHIAAPFRVNGASALFSPMLLAAPSPPQGQSAPTSATAEAMLDLRDVLNLDLHARLAVLSDGVALSMRDAASEVGLVQWAWRTAGVPWVVLPRWASDDTAREALVRELHRQLRSGKSPDDALLAARRSVQQTARWKAPFYWTGWIAIGGQ
jgi:tetratricopeptide (TPR) repeat protein